MAQPAVKSTGRNDYSGVPVWELSAVVGPYVQRMRDAADSHEDWSLRSWVKPIEGLSSEHVTMVLRHGQPTIPLHITDLICHAMGDPYLIHTFTFVPQADYSSYAHKMAMDEYIAEFNADPPKDFLERRAEELRELRKQILARATFAPKPLSV